MFSKNLFSEELDRLDEISTDPYVRLAVLEAFNNIFTERKRGVDIVAGLLKSDNEYLETIKEVIRECVDTVLKGFEKFRDSR